MDQPPTCIPDTIPKAGGDNLQDTTHTTQPDNTQQLLNDQQPISSPADGS